MKPALTQTQATLGEEAGAHHGDPTLFERDVKLLQACMLWIHTARGCGRLGYGPNWLPGHVDFLKSRLFWRIRSGKAPLPSAPPTSYSCPWYEVVEDGVPHSTGPANWTHFYPVGSEFFGKTLERGLASINQCLYDIIDERDGAYVVGYGPWRFRVYSGTYDQTYLDANQKAATRAEPTWYIQRAPELEAQ